MDDLIEVVRVSDEVGVEPVVVRRHAVFAVMRRDAELIWRIAALRVYQLDSKRAITELPLPDPVPPEVPKSPPERPDPA